METFFWKFFPPTLSFHLINNKKNPSYVFFNYKISFATLKNRPGTAASSHSFNTGQNTGRDDDLIGLIQIPCVHFVNYNTEWYFRVPNKTDGNLVLEVFPS